MKEKKPFSDSRWHDNPLGKNKATGYKPVTEEEDKRATELLSRILQKRGIVDARNITREDIENGNI